MSGFDLDGIVDVICRECHLSPVKFEISLRDVRGDNGGVVPAPALPSEFSIVLPSRPHYRSLCALTKATQQVMKQWENVPIRFSQYQTTGTMPLKCAASRNSIPCGDLTGKQPFGLCPPRPPNRVACVRHI